MKRCLKIVLSLALALVLAGSLSSVAEAHSGHHTRRAKSIRATAYTTNRNQASETTNNGAADNTTADTGAADSALAAVPAEPDAPAQVPDAEPVYASCYENGYCSGNNSCDVNVVRQFGPYLLWAKEI